MLAVGAEVRRQDGGWHAQSGVIFRTARSLMKGAVALRA
jgi:2-methylaconitate cis-trans-isomerase PrpF